MVCPPILMLCSVTEDSSLAVAGSHFSAAFASGACAARRATCPNKTKIPTAHIQKLFFIRLLPLIKFDWLATDETAGLYVEAERESKGVLSSPGGSPRDFTGVQNTGEDTPYPTPHFL